MDWASDPHCVSTGKMVAVFSYPSEVIPLVLMSLAVTVLRLTRWLCAYAEPCSCELMQEPLDAAPHNRHDIASLATSLK